MLREDSLSSKDEKYLQVCNEQPLVHYRPVDLYNFAHVVHLFKNLCMLFWLLFIFMFTEKSLK